MAKPNLTSEAFKSQKTLTGKQFRTGPLGDALNDTYTDVDTAFNNTDRGVKVTVTTVASEGAVDGGTMYPSTGVATYMVVLKALQNKTTYTSIKLPWKMNILDWSAVPLDDLSGASANVQLTITGADAAAGTGNAVVHVAATRVDNAGGTAGTVTRGTALGGAGGNAALNAEAADRYLQFKLVASDHAHSIATNGVMVQLHVIQTSL